MNNLDLIFSPDIAHHAFWIKTANKEMGERMIFRNIREVWELPTTGNPDLLHLHKDRLSINDCRYIKNWYIVKPVYKRKICIIAVNSILIEAQNSILKLLEEPKTDSIFFLLTDSDFQPLPTLRSRMMDLDLAGEAVSVEPKPAEFLEVGPVDRLVLIKELLDSKDQNLIRVWLNELEKYCFDLSKNNDQHNVTINNVWRLIELRSLLSQPSAPTKSIVEYLALTLPLVNKGE